MKKCNTLPARIADRADRTTDKQNFTCHQVQNLKLMSSTCKPATEWHIGGQFEWNSRL